MAKPFLSVVIPITSNDKNLPLVLVDLDRNLSKEEYSSEIIVSNVGANPELSEVVKNIAQTIKNLKLVESEPDASLGSAIRQAMLLASGNIRLLALSGRSIPVDQLKTMIPHFKSGADLVFGARTLDDQNSRLPLRFILSKSADLFARLFVKDVKDPFSDFVAVSEEATEKIFNDFKPVSKLINLRILFAAKKKIAR